MDNIEVQIALNNFRKNIPEQLSELNDSHPQFSQILKFEYRLYFKLTPENSVNLEHLDF